MVGVSKILTVSYGTFSCTVEGFDDPVETVRRVAEYFRDLSDQNVVFDESLALPDDNDLLSLTQETEDQQVHASVAAGSVHLRAVAAATPAAAGIVPELHVIANEEPLPSAEDVDESAYPTAQFQVVGDPFADVSRDVSANSPGGPFSWAEQASALADAVDAAPLADEFLFDGVELLPPDNDEGQTDLAEDEHADADEPSPVDEIPVDEIAVDSVDEDEPIERRSYAFDIDFGEDEAETPLADPVSQDEPDAGQTLAAPDEAANDDDTADGEIDLPDEPEPMGELAPTGANEKDATEELLANEVISPETTDDSSLPEEEIAENLDRPVVSEIEAEDEPAVSNAPDEAGTTVVVDEDAAAPETPNAPELENVPASASLVDDGFAEPDENTDGSSVDGDVADLTDPEATSEAVAPWSAGSLDVDVSGAETVESDSGAVIAPEIVDEPTSAGPLDSLEEDDPIDFESIDPISGSNGDAVVASSDEETSAENDRDEHANAVSAFDIAFRKVAGAIGISSGTGKVSETVTENGDDAILSEVARQANTETEQVVAGSEFIDATEEVAKDDQTVTVVASDLESDQSLMTDESLTNDDAGPVTPAEDEAVASNECEEDELADDEGDVPVVRKLTSPEFASRFANVAALKEQAEAEADAENSPQIEDIIAKLAKSEAAAERRNAVLERGEGEEDRMNRLLHRTNSQLAGAENKRRRSAIAHLKAAVMATKAEGKSRNNRSIDPSKQYRDDLARVVRHSRIPSEEEVQAVKSDLEGAAGETMPASDDTSSMQETTASEMPLEPTSPVVEPTSTEVEQQPDTTVDEAVGETETAGEEAPLMLVPSSSTAEQGEQPIAGENNPASGALEEFADRTGVSSLQELLECAAAFVVTEQEQENFTHLDLMNLAIGVSGYERTSREQSLRAFGQLLRQGKIKKVTRGQFTVSQSSRFIPEARSAAN